MPHQYGIPGYGQQTPPSPPTHHGGALIPRLGGGAVIPVSANTNAGSMLPSGTPIFRGPIEERRLTRDAMEKYLRDRNNMVIVILHAKVIIYSSFNHHHHHHQRQPHWQRISFWGAARCRVAEVKCVFLLPTYL